MCNWCCKQNNKKTHIKQDQVNDFSPIKDSSFIAFIICLKMNKNIFKNLEKEMGVLKEKYLFLP